MSAEPAYASAQRPSDLARFTSARPGGRMRFSLMSRATWPRLILDHMLFERLGPKRWRYCFSSRLSAWLSIQPQQMASSSASAYVTLGMPEPFLENFNQTPSDDA